MSGGRSPNTAEESNMVDLIRESSIRNQFEGPVIALLDLWKSLSEDKTGSPIEVLVSDRHENPDLKEFEGELSTAYPHIIEGRVRLVLWLENLEHVTDVLLTHELGHWVLFLQGYKGIKDPNNRHSNTEILLNSLATHRPLYILQRSLGIEPREEIDSRARNTKTVFSRDDEPNSKPKQIENALLVADDLMNCSSSIRDELEGVISERHPNTYSLVRTIIETASHYDLLDKEQNGKFLKMVVRKLKLGDGWRFRDDVSTLKSKVAESR